jgi:hypothetical protein
MSPYRRPHFSATGSSLLLVKTSASGPKGSEWYMKNQSRYGHPGVDTSGQAVSRTTAPCRISPRARRLAVLAVAAGAALTFSSPAFAASPQPPTLSPTQTTFTIPAGSTATWMLRLWSHGTLLGSDSATSGSLAVPVPATSDCTFQADVSVTPIGGHSSYYSGRRATVPGCGPLPTIAGDIYLCPPTGATTTEVLHGTLAASGPQTVPSQPNPMAPTPVASGTYTVTAGSPPGYMFVACGGSATIAAGGASATESVPVFIGDTGSVVRFGTVSGGGGVAIFYVTTIPTPVGRGGGTTAPGASGLTSIQTTPGPALAAGHSPITPGTAPLRPTPVPSAALAFTGMDIKPLLLGGLLSLALGTILLASSRVRRRTNWVRSGTSRW